MEYEYKPQKTVRDEERERHQEELERRRQERRLWEEEKANEKMNRPKKASKKVSKNKEWAVEAIKGKGISGHFWWNPSTRTRGQMLACQARRWWGVKSSTWSNSRATPNRNGSPRRMSM